MSELEAKELIVEAKEYYDMRHELCEYHMLEQELGIDLITFFKALEYGVYRKNQSGQIYHTLAWLYDTRLAKTQFNLSFRLRTEESFILESSNYGKTWALTREELE